MFVKTRTAKTRLIFSSSSLTDDVDQLGRRQPDWILVSKEAKRIAIIDLCRPSDIHQTQLQAAAIRKQQAYQPLVEGLSYYTEQGWVVHVFPLIVGIRGMIDSSHVQSLLKFLDIQRKHWQTAIEQTALASVRAFHFLHKLRFGGPLDRVQLDTDHSSAGADDVGTTVTKRKFQTTSEHFGGDDSDSDSHEQVRLHKENRQLRKPRLLFLSRSWPRLT
jgi:hypothetical protein